MTSMKLTRPQGAADRVKRSLLGGENGPQNSPSNPAVQAAIAELHRDFVNECLRIAAVKASHAADNILLGDDITSQRDIQLAIEYLREGARSFLEWQASLAGSAP